MRRFYILFLVFEIGRYTRLASDGVLSTGCFHTCESVALKDQSSQDTNLSKCNIG